MKLNFKEHNFFIRILSYLRSFVYQTLGLGDTKRILQYDVAVTWNEFIGTVTAIRSHYLPESTETHARTQNVISFGAQYGLSFTH